MTAPGKKLDIAQIVPYYPPHLGGMEAVAASLAEGLAVNNRVRVFDIERRGRQRVDTPTGGQPVGPALPDRRVANTPIFPTALPSILALPQHTVLPVHVVQAFAPELATVGSLLRQRPLVAHYHCDVPPSTHPRLLAAYKRHVLAPILRRAKRVIVLDDAQASAVHDWYRVPADRIKVLANGVDDRFFSGEEIEEIEEIEDRPYWLLFVGRLSGEKNVTRLLDTAGLLDRPFELVIVGEGEQGDELRRRAAATGPPGIRFVGQQSGEALVDWYRWADVLVSTSDGEGMPLVFLEAMAAGVPIVGTDVPAPVRRWPGRHRRAADCTGAGGGPSVARR